ncbi:hypothetical protein AURDEDRAFT_170838 [Auricularia subglabra TFB-10046 SS5]|nr:hypothetical protein AURDEDRAFT_170838 [Auricularia subglabra TFB-10046 SS5]
MLRFTEHIWNRIFDAVCALQAADYIPFDAASAFPSPDPSVRRVTRGLIMAPSIVKDGRLAFASLKSLAATSSSIRLYALPRVYSFVHLSRDQSLFTVHAHISRSSLSSPYLFTRTLSIPIWFTSLLDHHLALVRHVLPNLVNLFLRVNWRVTLPYPADYARVFAAINQFLSTLPAPSLRFFALSISPPYDPPVSNDILADMANWQPLSVPLTLEILDFRPNFMIHRCAPPPQSPPFTFLPTVTLLREVRLSSSDFVICSTDNWRFQPRLERVCIDAFTQSGGDSVHRSLLSTALHRAVPVWTNRLSVLQMFGFVFDAQTAIALSQLHSLQHLDLHAVSFDLGPAYSLLSARNDNLLQSQRLLEMQQRRRSVDGWRPLGLRVAGGPPGRENPVVCDLLAHLSDPAFCLLQLCLPSLPQLRSTHLGERQTCTHVSYDRLLVSDHLPLEIWLDILENYIADRRARLGAMEAFVCLCTHSRFLAFSRAYTSMTMHAASAFLLRHFVAHMDATDVPSIFENTASVQLLTTVDDLLPLLEVPHTTLPALRRLDIIAKPVTAPLMPFEFSVLDSALATIHDLDYVTKLTSFSLYLFFDHKYSHDASIDAFVLPLTAFTAVESLSLRLGGGIRLHTSHGLALPRTVRSLRVTVQILAVIDNSAWASCAALNHLHIEEERSRIQTPRRTTRDAARQLSSPVAAAAAAWSRSLTFLVLHNTYLEYAGVLAVGQISSLTRLDFHPSASPLNTSERLSLAHLANETPMPPLHDFPEHILGASGVGPLAGPIPFPYGALDLTDSIRYLLSRLRRLQVLHFGGWRHADWDIGQVSPIRVQREFLRIFDEVGRFVPDSLSFWHFGAVAPDRPSFYLHMPTCGLCATQQHSARSAECIAREKRLAPIQTDDPEFVVCQADAARLF